MVKQELLSWIELSDSALKHNVRSLKKLAGKRILAVSVKANAYGHGLPEIVGLLKGQSAVACITVHSLDEALTARQIGWNRKIIVLGPIPPNRFEEVIIHDLEPVIFDKGSLNRLGKLTTREGVRIKTHLKLETGTYRQGITQKELPAFAEMYRKYPYLGKPYGASMHFANIEDTTNHEYAESQLRCFRRLVKEMVRLKIKPIVRHTACSAALILFDKTRFELVRPGISAYGHWSSKETYLSYRLEGGHNDLFHPVLSWRTRVTQIKHVPRDAFVGYGCTYRTTLPSRLAVLPIGYADGYDRGLSNTAHVLIKGKRAPVRGRVCMNLMMVDVTDIKGVKLGDEVTLIGRSGDEEITAEQLADWAGTINYEILARLSPLIPRAVTA
ncbi:MAG: alanine racemase [candidate division Zixibacteria bacterium]|nr:alanine racemase [candidate division Zixibacteria bacterium]